MLSTLTPEYRRIIIVFAALCLLALVCASLNGCGTRTIYIPNGEPVRLRATIRGAAVWVFNAEGQEVPGVMDLPEGWYAMPYGGGEAGE